MSESGTKPGRESHRWEKAQRQWPEKFKADARLIFKEIRPSDRIFVGTGCGDPQFLVQSLLGYVRENPRALMDAELITIVTLGVARGSLHRREVQAELPPQLFLHRR